MKSNIFNKESHESCCKEHSHCILEGKMEFKLGCCIVLLEVTDFEKNEAHDEFVEKNHQNQGYVDNCICYFKIVLAVIGMLNQRCFFRKDKKENNSDAEKEKSSQTPASHNPEYPLMPRIVNVLPADLLWLRGLC